MWKTCSAGFANKMYKILDASTLNYGIYGKYGLYGIVNMVAYQILK